ncbi:MAG: FAD-dependent oxidoreductase, partial [Alphaproteobacteria bacterium]|nr:FAD-dependent oxidoreductase [Alphaproteobacteria bacterium]
MTTGHVHVIGAGLAGLAAAVTLAARGARVSVHEAGDHAGGRCRSYDDAALGCRLDNGNHLLLAANRNVMAYLDAIGARESLVGPAVPLFPFVDLATGKRWVLRPNRGRLPWWIFSAGRRIPETRPVDYLEALRLLRAPAEATVTQRVDPRRMLYQRLWAPLAIAALNTQPEEASARMLGDVLRMTFGAGGDACRPMVPAVGLSESFVDPALVRLAALGASVRFGRRLREIQTDEGGIRTLRFVGDDVDVAQGDRVVLAVPPAIAAALLPEIATPTAFRAIVNAHYRIAAPRDPAMRGADFIGLIGGLPEWVFVKPGIASVTISAADRLVEQPSAELAATIWRDVAAALDLDAATVPPWRIVKERRATFAATPEQLTRRAGATTRWP